MLDVHMLTLPTADAELVSTCWASIQAAAKRAPFPVVLHMAPGIPGDFGAARLAAYKLGTQPYVAAVDDDDYLLPDALAMLADALQKRPAAVFTRELALIDGQLVPGNRLHKLAVYRRDIAERDYPTGWRENTDAHVRAGALAEPGRVIELDAPGYVWRIHESHCRKQRRNINKEGCLGLGIDPQHAGDCIV